MAKLKRYSINFVALGRQNPQILTTDWLKANAILPLDQQPFKKLFAQEQPFSKFVSTPVLTNLVMDTIEFLVDPERFQITDKAIDRWSDSRIIDIGRKYFDVLHHTPLKLVGTNMTAKVEFSDPQESRRFQELFLPASAAVLKIVDRDDVNASAVIRYPYPGDDARVTLSFGESNKAEFARMINFNYEFDFTDWEEFHKQLAQIENVAEYCDSLLDKLLGGQ